MIPLTLRFKAFASYIGEAFIDFTELNSLFLIQGDTGAGKTAILDAITYSLYGETSGKERSAIRCALPQAENTDTEIEFIFKVNNKTYKFTRLMYKTPRSKKIAEKHDCFYLDEKAGAFIPFFENPIMSTVNSKAVEILGLTASQFRQVIILPQGKFENLLTSNSEEKEALLTTLFDADKYTRLSDILSKQANAERLLIDKEKSELEAMLKNEGAASAEVLAEEISRFTEESDGLKQILNNSRQKLKDAQDKLSEAVLVDKWFSEYEEIKSAMQKNSLRQTEITEFENLLSMHNKAVSANHFYQLYINSAQALDKRKSVLSEREYILTDSLKKIDMLKIVTEEYVKTDVMYLPKKEYLLKLNSVRELYERAQPAREKADILYKKLDKAEKDYEESKKALNITERKLETISTERGLIQTDFSEKLPILQSELIRLEQGKAAYENAVRYKKALSKIKTETSRLEGEILKLNIEIDEAQLKYDGIYSSHIKSLSAQLALQLIENSPCPVCGSINHPAPAKHIGSVSADNVKSAHYALEELVKKRDAMQNEHDRQSDRIIKAETEIQTQDEIAEKYGYSEEKLAYVKEMIIEAEKQTAKLNELEIKHNRLSEINKKQSSEADMLLETRYRVYDEHIKAKAEAEHLSSQLVSNIPSLKEYTETVTNLDNEISLYENKKNAHEELCRQTERDYIRLRVAHEQAEEEKVSAESEYEKCLTELQEKLLMLGIADINEYLKSVLSDDTVSYYTESIKKIKQSEALTKARYAELTELLKEKIRPDISVLESLKLEYEIETIETEKKSAVINDRLERLIRIKVEYEKRSVIYNAAAEKNSRRLQFAEFMRGSKGISFTRYVLGVMLTLVTTEANSLLKSVHGGQFSLHLSKDWKSNKKNGLELLVETSVMDSSMKYDVKGLSGGEKFLLSLVMSMGLSTVAQSLSGGIDIDTMFIDEGFGTLDPTSLREAVDILCHISGSRQKIGVISHVPGLSEVITNIINVKKDMNGSRITVY